MTQGYSASHLHDFLADHRVASVASLTRPNRFDQRLLASVEHFTPSLKVRSRQRSGSSQCRVPLVALSRGVLGRPESELLHDLGLAETRLRLGELPGFSAFSGGRWLVCGRPRQGTGEMQDAVWSVGGMDVAVEFDAGSYDGAVTRRKLRAFGARGFDTVVWSSTVRRRTKSVPVEVGRVEAADGLGAIRRVIVLHVDVSVGGVYRPWGANKPFADMWL